MAAKLDELTDEYFENIFTLGRTLINVKTKEPNLPIESVLEHPETEVDGWEDIGFLVGIKAVSARTNLPAYPWLFESFHHTRTDLLETYAYVKAIKSGLHYGSGRTNPDLRIALARLVEHERSLYPSGDGVGAGIGTPVDASSASTGIFERTGYELYQIFDLFERVKLENGDYILDSDEIMERLPNLPELSDSLRTRYSKLFEKDGEISLGSLATLVWYIAKNDTREFGAVITEFSGYLKEIVAFDTFLSNPAETIVVPSEPIPEVQESPDAKSYKSMPEYLALSAEQLEIPVKAGQIGIVYFKQDSVRQSKFVRENEDIFQKQGNSKVAPLEDVIRVLNPTREKLRSLLGVVFPDIILPDYEAERSDNYARPSESDLDVASGAQRSHPDPIPGISTKIRPALHPKSRSRVPVVVEERPRKPYIPIVPSRAVTPEEITALRQELGVLSQYRIVNTELIIPPSYHWDGFGVNVPLDTYQRRWPERFGKRGNITLGNDWDVALMVAHEDISPLNIMWVRGLRIFDETLVKTGKDYDAAFDAVKKMPVRR